MHTSTSSFLYWSSRRHIVCRSLLSIAVFNGASWRPGQKQWSRSPTNNKNSREGRSSLFSSCHNIKFVNMKLITNELSDICNRCMHCHIWFRLISTTYTRVQNTHNYVQEHIFACIKDLYNMQYTTNDNKYIILTKKYLRMYTEWK